jgi:trimeric autotransporter adhesin
MKKLIALLFLLLGATGPAWATFTRVQHVVNTGCAAGTSCTLSVSATGAGNILMVAIATPGIAKTISSVSAGGTFSHCSGSNGSDANGASSDIRYTLNSSSGVTSITVTLSSSVVAPWTVALEEYSFTGTVSVDTCGSIDNSINTARGGVVLTALTGTNDLLMQAIATGATIQVSAINGAYSSATDFGRHGFAVAANSVVGTAPIWTFTGNSRSAGSGLAIKEAGGGSPSLGGISFQGGIAINGSMAIDTQVSDFTCPATGGPPNYLCSRSDFLIAQDQTPTMGHRNDTATPGDFNNPIVQVTDKDTLSSDVNRSYHMSGSGANAENGWNSDSTMLLILRENTGTFRAIGFDPSTMQATIAIPSFQPNAVTTWAHTDPKVAYNLAGMQIVKYTFTDAVTPPTSAVLYDFVNCAAAPLAANVTSRMNIFTSADDTIIATAVSTAGGQGTGVWVLAYNTSLNQCSVYNTSTGQVAGNWGTTGAATDSDHFTLHDVYMGRGAGIVDLSSGGCTSGACLSTPKSHWFWTPGTTTVTACLRDLGHAGSCGGHSAPGATVFLNFDTFPKVETRLYSSPNTFTLWSGSLPAFSSEIKEAHMGWQSSAADSCTAGACTTAFFGTAVASATTYTAALSNTIFGYTPNGKLRRFAHTFTTRANTSFYDQNAIGAVSQDGRFFAWTSDMHNTLGTGVGNSDGHRNDVFVVKLQ